MKKFWTMFMFMLMAVVTMTSCHSVSPDADEEAALTEKPVFWGDGGVVDEAVEASKPYNINYVKENLIYILVGFVLASAIIFIIYYFDTTIKSSEIVEDKLGLTVIGIVPKEEKE